MHKYEQQHLFQLREHLAECTVLLKSKGDFPLDGPCRIAAYGSGVRHTVKGGTGSGEVNSRFFVTVEQGLKEAGFEITTASWLDAYDEIRENAHREFIQSIKARARKNHTLAVIEGMGAVMPEPEYTLPLEAEGDTAIYVLSRISGEGNDRAFVSGDILLSGTEVRDIMTLQHRYRHFLLVLNVGGPVDLTPVLSVDNILVLSQLGVETGRVLADLLLGKAYPSGKLTTTWASQTDYQRIGDFGDIDETRYKEGIYVGYRYFDTMQVKPLFPFGYGIGYTGFETEYRETAADGAKITVRAAVKNIGSRPGREILQLYVSAPAGRLDQPQHVLAAFAKTGELAPGEEEVLELITDMRDLASYDEENSEWILEEGTYVLNLGTSSADTQTIAGLHLKETAVVRKVRKALGEADFEDWKPSLAAVTDPDDLLQLDGASVFEMDPEDLKLPAPEYDRSPDVDPFIQSLTDEELAYINVGAFDPKGGIASIIGSAGTTVAGAAGETTGVLKEKGMPVLIMADGPAGLRLSRDYAQDEDGEHALGSFIPESMEELLPGPARLLMKLTAKKPSKKAVRKQHFATAIPIGTALAQSWNIKFAELCGDIVGNEMERFGVHLWLAPALNIHRDIRCGRNFEYFSEDPLISGRFAAAVTRGVQAHPGRGVTIKHFAANNQETNRYNNNSQVSERAMREIYLRGFEICVRESQPYALMTSYNLLNGIHTSERRDLIEDILRAEFGFEGIVMTDWVVNGGTMNKRSVHPAPHASAVAAAGGDLMMPGNKNDYQDILEALEASANAEELGETEYAGLTRSQLEANAARVYRMALKLAGTGK